MLKGLVSDNSLVLLASNVKIVSMVEFSSQLCDVFIGK